LLAHRIVIELTLNIVNEQIGEETDDLWLEKAYQSDKFFLSMKAFFSALAFL